jgi:hypothetical protein
MFFCSVVRNAAARSLLRVPARKRTWNRRMLSGLALDAIVDGWEMLWA